MPDQRKPLPWWFWAVVMAIIVIGAMAAVSMEVPTSQHG